MEFLARPENLPCPLFSKDWRRVERFLSPQTTNIRRTYASGPSTSGQVAWRRLLMNRMELPMDQEERQFLPLYSPGKPSDMKQSFLVASCQRLSRQLPEEAVLQVSSQAPMCSPRIFISYKPYSNSMKPISIMHFQFTKEPIIYQTLYFMFQLQNTQNKSVEQHFSMIQRLYFSSCGVQ